MEYSSFWLIKDKINRNPIADSNLTSVFNRSPTVSVIKHGVAIMNKSSMKWKYPQLYSRTDKFITDTSVGTVKITVSFNHPGPRPPLVPFSYLQSFKEDTIACGNKI
jgi:hypothetical protein